MNKALRSILIISFALLFVWCNNSAAYELDPADEAAIGPVGQEIYKLWTDTIGYSALDLVKEMDPAPEIKPGLVITPENAKNYPGLKKIMPDTMYKRLDPNHFLPYRKITIVPTRARYWRKAFTVATKENMGKCKINPDTLMLENYVAGLPFPRNPNPLEMIWNETMWAVGEDDLYFDPISALTYSSARKMDSSWKAGLGWYRGQGRLMTDFDPVTHESLYFKGKGILDIGTFLLTYPQDLLGVAFLRYRYYDTNKPDLFMSYLPGMKRIRVLSGSDAQDPMIGSELKWDMWRGDWQKQPSKTLFPNAYKLLKTQIMLLPVHHYSPALEIQGEAFITSWEKRPVWVFEIKSLDPAYIYSKRIMYIDMEEFKLNYEEYFDRRGNLWLTWDDIRYRDAEGGSSWEAVFILNWESQRDTVLKMNSKANPDLDPADFDMRWLNRMAR